MRLTSLCKKRCEAVKTKLNEITRVNPDLQRKDILKVLICYLNARERNYLAKRFSLNSNGFFYLNE